MPPLLPDEATKAQETFRLGDRFYVEEHGVGSGRTNADCQFRK